MTKQKPTLNQADVVMLLDEFSKVFATKNDLKDLEQRLEERFDELREEFDGKFVNKDEFCGAMDDLMKELKDSREDREILNGRTVDLRERVEKLEEVVGVAA